MIYILQNAVPILLATVASFAFGAAWYMALSKPWMRASGVTETQAKAGGPWPFVIAFAAEAWMASILAGALILAPVEAGVWTVALGTAFILWIGFVFPVLVVNHRYQGAPWSLTLIDGGHWLGVLWVQALVLRAVGVEAPTA